jgi:DNA repair photolyase
MLERLDEIQQFDQFWFVTITPYGKEIEPNVPAKKKVIEAFQELSKKIGKKRIGWRYDPIFLSEKYTIDFHVEQFEKMTEQLSEYTSQCVISFIDPVSIDKEKFSGVKALQPKKADDRGEFAQIGKKYNMPIRSCCEGTDLECFGIDASGCMTKEVLEVAKGCEIVPSKGRKSPRAECNCLLGNDIGMYNTCGHGCLYCYANYDNRIVRNNRDYISESPLLVGEIQRVKS